MFVLPCNGLLLLFLSQSLSNIMTLEFLSWNKENDGQGCFSFSFTFVAFRLFTIFLFVGLPGVGFIHNSGKEREQIEEEAGQ